ncbi:MAG: NAD-dependent dehydratase [Proteobacteria bacterium]|nr:NAD-dependent dehydratase [Pseudomonadota bacterium]HQR02764.1 hypothetical protein [Rhodocyclaceae bacterium]
MHALVIGGTGPTGPFIVNGLLARGWKVEILHTGNHEVDEIPPEVVHIHVSPHDPVALAAAVGDRKWDLCIATYGRLRSIAEIFAGRVGRFISVGGGPGYLGYMNPFLHQPEGIPGPLAEDSPKVSDPAQDEKGWRIVRTEAAVFHYHPDATHFRYPFVYGPYQPAPREWMVVRRVLDGRRRIILPDGGLTLDAYGYAGNIAHAILLAVDQPEQARGEIFNVADSHALSLRDVVFHAARALDWEFEIIDIPAPLALPALPLLTRPTTTHRLYDITKLRTRLGYRDAVAPAEAVASTARWLAAHPPPPVNGYPVEAVLQDPFDYAAEDQLIERWQRALTTVEMPVWSTPPGYGMAYSGPGGRPRSKAVFEEAPLAGRSGQS